MLKRPWNFLNNPFLAVTRDSFEKAVTLSTYTDAALAADPSAAVMYSFYHPLHVTLVTAFKQWKAQGGRQQGSTAGLDALLHDLTGMLNDWDAAIRLVYRKGTPGYIKLLPHGHEPFTHGKQEMRIAAVQALSDNLADEPDLQTVKTGVDSFLDSLTKAHGDQKGHLSQTDVNSDSVETARVAACGGLYCVLGWLMQQHYNNTESIGAYFNLGLIRSGRQTDFTGAIAANAVHTIAKRSLEADDEIVLSNTGSVPLTFYLATAKDAQPAAGAGIGLQPGAQLTTTASALGAPSAAGFLMVYNPSAIAAGSWEAEIY